jgi:hypothetical protein
MGAGLTAAALLSPRPHIIVVFTDGHTPWPDAPPRKVDSVIVVLSDPATQPQVPKWARIITIE